MNSDREIFQRAKDYLEDDRYYWPAWENIAPLVSEAEDFDRVMEIIEYSVSSGKLDHYLTILGGFLASVGVGVIFSSYSENKFLPNLVFCFSMTLCALMPGTLFFTFLSPQSFPFSKALGVCHKTIRSHPTRPVYEKAIEHIKASRKKLLRQIWLDNLLILAIWSTPLLFAGLYRAFLPKNRMVEEVFFNGIPMLLVVIIPMCLIYALLRSYFLGIYRPIPEVTIFREAEDGIPFSISAKWELIEGVDS